MIRELFVPRVIGNYYIIPQRILGIEINKTAIHATRLYASRANISIEECIEQPIEPGPASNFAERVQQALIQLSSKVKPYETVHSAISSSQLVFKKIKLPFIDRAKIQMVVAYEVEPLLPFAASEAVVDFIITATNQAEKSSELLVVAARKQYIEEHMQLFQGTDITPDVIGVDLIALYSLYKRIGSYNALTGAAALIDLGMHETRILYLYDAQLKLVRILNKGVADVAQTIGVTINMQAPQALETLLRIGLESSEQHEFTASARTAFNAMINEINFTLTSFATQEQVLQPVAHITLSGEGAAIPGLVALVSNVLQAQTKILHVHELVQELGVTLKKNSSLANRCIISLGVALPSPITNQFNLLQKTAGQTDLSHFYKFAGTSLVLALLCIGILYTHTFLQQRKIRSEVTGSEQELVLTLKEKFPSIDQRETNLEDIVEAAQQQVRTEQKVWFAFSTPSPLKYILELFTKVDRQATGLMLEKLNIDEGVMTIKAQVTDHAALKVFERDLRQSKLFSTVEGQEDPKFTMKITLVQSQQEGTWGS